MFLLDFWAHKRSLGVLLKTKTFKNVNIVHQVLCEDRQSPLLGVNGSSEDKLFRSKSADVEDTTEKEQMRKMLSEG